MINLCPLTVGVKRANRSKTPGGSGPHGAGKGGWSVVRAREARRRRRAARGSTAQRVASTSQWGPANRQASHRPRRHTTTYTAETGKGRGWGGSGSRFCGNRTATAPVSAASVGARPNTVGGFPDPASRQVPPLSSPSQFPSHPPPKKPTFVFSSPPLLLSIVFGCCTRACTHFICFFFPSPSLAPPLVLIC